MDIDTDEKRQLRAKELKEQEKQERESREQARKNRNFVQFYRNHMVEFSYLIDLNPIAAKLLLFILEHMDNMNALVCSYAIFEDNFGVTKDTIRRAIKVLKDNGFLDILKIGTSNVYVINQEIAWSSWENQKQYCQFDGKILVSRKENKDYDYHLQAQRFKALRETEYVKRQRVAAKKYGLRGANNDND